MSAIGEPLLRVEDLHVRFGTERGLVHAVNGISENDFICAAKVDALLKV